MTGAELLSSADKFLGPKIKTRSDFRGEHTISIAREDVREVALDCGHFLAEEQSDACAAAHLQELRTGTK